MRISLRKLIIVAVALLGLSSLSLYRLNGTASAATAQDQICAGLGATDGGDGCSDSSGSTSLSDTVAAAINIMSVVVGAIAVIMIVVGGLKYVSSQGDSSGVASAKNTIVYALVGIIIVVLAQVMVRFVITRATTASQDRNTAPRSRPN